MHARASYYITLILVSIGAVAFVGYSSRHPEVRRTIQSVFGLAPCQKPLPYSLGRLDTQFGLSTTTVLQNLADASAVWEKVIGHPLFVLSKNGPLKINFIYDYRQKATETLKTIDKQIDTGRMTYAQLKAQYEAKRSSFEAEKQSVEALIAQFDADKATYERDIAYWNTRGGAPKREFAALDAAGRSLKQTADLINTRQTSLNNTIAELNALASQLNQSAKAVNADVRTYNAVGNSTGRVFDEGMYRHDASGTSISIYQFSSAAERVRVLSHELGHALGLDHVSNPNALMYAVNQGGGMTPTKEDIAELKKVCGIQ